MSERAALLDRAGLPPVPPAIVEAWLPPAAVALLGAGLAAAAAGAASGRDGLALTGAAAAALGLLVLMAGDWVDPLVAVALSLPLPALYAAGDLRLAPAAPLTGLVLAAWVAGWPARPGPVARGRLPVPALAAFAAAYAGAALVSDHRGAAARELANMGVLLLLLLVATDLLRRQPGRATGLVRVLAAVAAGTGILAVLETVGVLPGRFPDAGALNRAALGFGQPNGLGMFLAITLPFAVHVMVTSPARWGRALAACAVAAIVAGLVGTFSRGSWLAVLAGAAVLPLAGGWRFTARVWATAALAALGADLLSGGEVRAAVLGLVTDWSVVQRSALMLAGVKMFLAHPLAGVGPGAFPLELERIGALVPDLWDLKPTPHNAYIQMAAEAGVLGLAAFVTLLAAILVRALRLARAPARDAAEASLRRAVLWAFAIVLLEGLVEWPFSHGHGQLVVLVAALACALPLGAAAGPGSPARRRSC
jgi:O-antigen ligase